MIYNQKTISHLQQYINQFDTAVLFGKGGTFQDRPRKDNEIYLAGNNSVNFLSECDILIMNDYSAVDLIDNDSYELVNYVMIPQYPHDDDGQPKRGLTYKSVMKRLKGKFKGHYIVINLPTYKESNEFLNTTTGASVINTGIDFIGQYTNIKNIETYGFGISPSYSENVINENKRFSDYIYKQDWIDMIRNTYNFQVNLYGLNGKIN